jgi:hypothetical protein
MIEEEIGISNNPPSKTIYQLYNFRFSLSEFDVLFLSLIISNICFLTLLYCFLTDSDASFVENPPNLETPVWISN